MFRNGHTVRAAIVSYGDTQLIRKPEVDLVVSGAENLHYTFEAHLCIIATVGRG
jgi:hypothetical protein